jgi:hypothetical protein
MPSRPVSGLFAAIALALAAPVAAQDAAHAQALADPDTRALAAASLDAG